MVKNGKLYWKTRGMLLFMDNEDVVRTPGKFFMQTVQFNCWVSPGPLRVNFLKTFWSFLCILLFLFFIFIVVMAFGDSYNVSSTNQLMVTVVGGLVPFMLRTVMARGGGGEEKTADSVQFNTQLQGAIGNFKQTWPVCDIGGAKPGNEESGMAEEDRLPCSWLPFWKEANADMADMRPCCCLTCWDEPNGMAEEHDAMRSRNEPTTKKNGTADEDDTMTGSYSPCGNEPGTEKNGSTDEDDTMPCSCFLCENEPGTEKKGAADEDDTMPGSCHLPSGSKPEAEGSEEDKTELVQITLVPENCKQKFDVDMIISLKHIKKDKKAKTRSSWATEEQEPLKTY